MISKNGAGLIVLFLSFIGLEANEEGILEVISAIGTIVSFALMLWHQTNRSDTEFILWKKDQLDKEFDVE